MVVEAKLKCSKEPIICTNQCGRSHNYCNGNCTCVYQVAVIECVDARQSKGSADQQTDNNRFMTALSSLKIHENGPKCRAWNEAIDACIEEIQRLNPPKAADFTKR